VSSPEPTQALQVKVFDFAAVLLFAVIFISAPLESAPAPVIFRFCSHAKAAFSRSAQYFLASAVNHHTSSYSWSLL
jgi:hypothetical protein